MKEMKIVDGRLNEKSRGLLGDMVSYHYWKVDGKKIENLEIPDTLDAHIDVGKPIRATYQPGKDNVNRIWAIQVEGEPVRSVVTIPFLVVSLVRLSILPLMIVIFTFFRCVSFLGKHLKPSPLQWFRLPARLARAQFACLLSLHD